MALPTELLPSLVLSQYADSPNLLSLLNIYCQELNLIQQVTEEIIDLRYIDKAFGVQLDLVGALVGAKRTLSGVLVTGYFGYLESAQSLGMGLEGDNRTGGIFKSNSDEEYQDIRLTDDLFLNWIKAKILLNNTEGGKEDCISFFKLLLNDMTLPVKISIPAKASLDVELGRQLSLKEVSLCIAYAKAIKPIGITMRLFDTVGEILLHDVNLIGDYFD